EPKPPAARRDGNNATVNYRGEERTNQRHSSTADPQAMLARKGPGKEAKLSYHGALMRDNRSGLVVSTPVSTAYGSAECHAGMLRQLRHRGLERVGWVFTLAAATYNLVRMRTLMPKCV